VALLPANRCPSCVAWWHLLVVHLRTCNPATHSCAGVHIAHACHMLWLEAVSYTMQRQSCMSPLPLTSGRWTASIA
jgi:hypothetical protein